jgi:cytochrome c biogenesis protein CcmG/thiol:disulfide interchange protein DsbE
MDSEQPDAEASDSGLVSRLLRVYRRPYVRTGVGLLVLVAIVTTLALISRFTGEGGDAGLVDIGDAPGGASAAGESAELGPSGGGAPKIGQPAPDFALRALDGGVQRLSDYRGQVVFVNFWATWCPPCRDELPDIQAIYDEKKDQGLVVLEVNYQESDDEVRDYWDSQGLTMPVLLDSSGSVLDQYRLVGVPDSFFVDRDGILREMHLGAISRKDMLKKLEKAGLP